MLQQRALNERYNELVLEYSKWLAELPRSVEAVFVPSSASIQQRERAVHVHAALLATYGLTADDLPLLVYDQRARSTAPFQLQ